MVISFISNKIFVKLKLYKILLSSLSYFPHPLQTSWSQNRLFFSILHSHIAPWSYAWQTWNQMKILWYPNISLDTIFAAVFHTFNCSSVLGVLTPSWYVNISFSKSRCSFLFHKLKIHWSTIRSNTGIFQQTTSSFILSSYWYSSYLNICCNNIFV